MLFSFIYDTLALACSSLFFSGCREGLNIYRLGEQMSSNKTCHNCYCSYGGVKKCKRIHCSPVMAGCTPITPEGHCCPVEYKCGNNNIGKGKLCFYVYCLDKSTCSLVCISLNISSLLNKWSIVFIRPLAVLSSPAAVLDLARRKCEMSYIVMHTVYHLSLDLLFSSLFLSLSFLPLFLLSLPPSRYSNYIPLAVSFFM